MHAIRNLVEGYLTNQLGLPPEQSHSKDELPITMSSKSKFTGKMNEFDGKVDIHHAVHFLHVDDIDQSKGTISLSVIFGKIMIYTFTFFFFYIFHPPLNT